MLDWRNVELGEDHISILGTKHNLAGAHSKQGNYEEAIKIYEVVLQQKKAVLGEHIQIQWQRLKI